MPPPASTRVGQLHVEVRYLPSANGPGGDIHDVLATPFGVRLLIGDVMGTGTTANQAGASVLGAWRELARSEPSLAGVAVRLHSVIAQSEHPEHFVTALLVNFPASVAAEDRTGYADPSAGSIGDSWAELVCCGHPPPLWMCDGTATYISSLPASPPLGLLDLAEGWCTATAIPFRADDRLLLYTDGVSEARDSLGRFFPLTDRAAAAMAYSEDAAGAGADGRHPLDHLMTSLRNHIGDRAAGTDDILMVLVERG